MKRRVIKGISYIDLKDGAVEVSCEEALIELRELLQESEAREGLGLAAQTLEWKRQIYDKVRLIANNERSDLHIDVGVLAPRDLLGEQGWQDVVDIARDMAHKSVERHIFRPHNKAQIDTYEKNVASGVMATIKHRW